MTIETGMVAFKGFDVQRFCEEKAGLTYNGHWAGF